MRKEWIAESKHGLTYHVSDGDSELAIPVYWKNQEEFLAEIELASQIAYGTNRESAPLPDEQGDIYGFHEAWMFVIKARMRRSRLDDCRRAK